MLGRFDPDFRRLNALHRAVTTRCDSRLIEIDGDWVTMSTASPTLFVEAFSASLKAIDVDVTLEYQVPDATFGAVPSGVRLFGFAPHPTGPEVAFGHQPVADSPFFPNIAALGRSVGFSKLARGRVVAIDLAQEELPTTRFDTYVGRRVEGFHLPPLLAGQAIPVLGSVAGYGSTKGSSNRAIFGRDIFLLGDRDGSIGPPIELQLYFVRSTDRNPGPHHGGIRSTAMQDVSGLRDIATVVISPDPDVRPLVYLHGLDDALQRHQPIGPDRHDGSRRRTFTTPGLPSTVPPSEPAPQPAPATAPDPWPRRSADPAPDRTPFRGSTAVPPPRADQPSGRSGHGSGTDHWTGHFERAAATARQQKLWLSRPPTEPPAVSPLHTLPRNAPPLADWWLSDTCAGFQAEGIAAYCRTWAVTEARLRPATTFSPSRLVLDETHLPKLHQYAQRRGLQLVEDQDGVVVLYGSDDGTIQLQATSRQEFRRATMRGLDAVSTIEPRGMVSPSYRTLLDEGRNPRELITGRGHAARARVLTTLWAHRIRVAAEQPRGTDLRLFAPSRERARLDAALDPLRPPASEDPRLPELTSNEGLALSLNGVSVTVVVQTDEAFVRTWDNSVALPIPVVSAPERPHTR